MNIIYAFLFGIFFGVISFLIRELRALTWWNNLFLFSLIGIGTWVSMLLKTNRLLGLVLISVVFLINLFRCFILYKKGSEDDQDFFKSFFRSNVFTTIVFVFYSIVF